MDNSVSKHQPEDVKLYLFGVFLERMWALIPQKIRDLLEALAFRVAPTVPVSLSDVLSDAKTKRTAALAATWTMFFCLVVNVGWTAVTGTLFGSDPNRIYFVDDWPNLVNYIFICPLYMACCSVLLTLVARSWPKLRSLAYGSSAPQRKRNLTLGAAVILVCGVSTALTAKYVSECLDPMIYEKVGWYIENVTKNGIRVLGPLGVYYSIMTFVLMAFCLAALLGYIAVFLACIQIGRNIAKEGESSTLTFDDLQSQLVTFTLTYLAAKLLAGALMMNAYTWTWEKPHGSFNLVAMGLALSIFGVFLVSVPRYYIELEWFRLKIRKAQALGIPNDIHYDDLRPFNVKLTAYIVDAVLVSGFMGSFWFR